MLMLAPEEKSQFKSSQTDSRPELFSELHTTIWGMYLLAHVCGHAGMCVFSHSFSLNKCTKINFFKNKELIFSTIYTIVSIYFIINNSLQRQGCTP